MLTQGHDKNHSQLYSRFKVSLGCMRPCLNKMGIICLGHNLQFMAAKSCKGAHVALSSSQISTAWIKHHEQNQLGQEVYS